MISRAVTGNSRQTLNANHMHTNATTQARPRTTGNGRARLGTAGKARRGRARQGEDAHGRLDMARYGLSAHRRLGVARLGMARLGNAGVARQGVARHGIARHKPRGRERGINGSHIFNQ